MEMCSGSCIVYVWRRQGGGGLRKDGQRYGMDVTGAALADLLANQLISQLGDDFYCGIQLEVM